MSTPTTTTAWLSTGLLRLVLPALETSHETGLAPELCQLADVEPARFDCLVSNPPYGTRAGLDEPERWALAYRWKKTGRDWEQTKRIDTQARIETVFIEHLVAQAKPGAYIAVVIGDNVLSGTSYEHARYWLLQRCILLASISLPTEVFLPYTGIKTSILLLRVMTEEEQAAMDAGANYSIFMAISERIGKDRRGRPIYRRGPDGRHLQPLELDSDLADIVRAYREPRVAAFGVIEKANGAVSPSSDLNQ